MKKTVFFIITLALLLPACNREAMPGPGEAVVHINVSLIEDDVATKFPITGSSFSAYSPVDHSGTYGIFVCLNGTTDTAHKLNSWNIMARYATEDNCLFYYVASLSSGEVASTGYNHITLTKRDLDNKSADLYAYAPYTLSAYANGPTAIPYSITNNIATQTDLMYAVENITSDNTDLSPTSNEPLTATFTFKHAFSLLNFRFKLGNNGSTCSLSDVTVRVIDPDSDGETTAKLYRSGTFNAITGTFNNDGLSPPSPLSVLLTDSGSSTPIPINSTSYDASANLMLVPTNVEDDELGFTFTVNGQTLQPFSLKASHLTRYEEDNTTPVDGTEGKLEGGYRYTFYFTLDNYLYLDGFTVGEWTTPLTPLGEQEI